MKKIAIITFHAAYNYGSALQATALQNFLEKNGYQVEILDFFDKLDRRQYKLFRTHYYFFPPIIIEDLKAYRNNKMRMQSYKNFHEKYMHITKKTFYSNEELEKICGEYDAFICGSDQIWNTGCTKGVKKPYYLDFAKDSKKFTMSYGPSIAHDHIEEKYQKDFAQVVNQIQVVSVREETGRDIIRALTGKEAKVVVDPTLLLGYADYVKMEESLKVPEKYVFVYCLEYNKEVFSYAEKIAREKKLELVYFRKYDMKQYGQSLNAFPYNPSHFLFLIHNAEYVITNSFHATVFSLIYNKLFITFGTMRSSSRMVDFLQKLDLSSRLSFNNHDIDAPIDYIEVKKRMETLAKDSSEFLLNSLAGFIGDQDDL